MQSLPVHETKTLFDPRMDAALGHITLALAEMPGLGILAAFHAKRSSADRLMITLEFTRALPTPTTKSAGPQLHRQRGDDVKVKTARRKTPCQQRRAPRRVGAVGNAAVAATGVAGAATERVTGADAARVQAAAKLSARGGVSSPPPPSTGAKGADAAAPREGGTAVHAVSAPHQSQTAARLPGHSQPPPPSTPSPSPKPPPNAGFDAADAAQGAMVSVPGTASVASGAGNANRSPLAGAWEVVGERRVSLTKRFGESPVKPSPKRQGGVG